MKQRTIFLGSFLIAFGIIFFLRNFELLPAALERAFKYWAVILILAGSALLIELPWLKSLLTSSTAAMLALVLWSSAIQLKTLLPTRFSDLAGASRSAKAHFFSETFDSTIQRARLRLDASIGDYTLVRPTTEHLLFAEAYTTLGDYELRRERLSGYEELVLKMKSGQFTFGWNFSVKNRLTLQLHPDPVWELDLNVGASSIDFDLRPFKVEKMTIEAGASSLDLKLGDLAPELFVSIDAGAASLDISIPASVGCRIRHRGALGDYAFDGFVQKGKDYYTENFESSSKKIYIDIDSGVSSISVQRY